MILYNPAIASNQVLRPCLWPYPARGGSVFSTGTAIISTQNTLIGVNALSDGVSPPIPDDSFGPRRSLGYKLAGHFLSPGRRGGYPASQSLFALLRVTVGN